MVEGWIGGPGIRAAASEFTHGGYQYIVSTGPLTGERWSDYRWNYALIGEQQLMKVGINQDRIIKAPAGDVEQHRTYRMAEATKLALAERSIQPLNLTIFTRGAHGRRSRLVYEKVFGPSVRIGVISWLPPDFEHEPWWHSSTRSEDMLKESVGYIFEKLLDSGR